MKLSRRLFFKSAPAAAVVGPEIVKNTVQEAMQNAARGQTLIDKVGTMGEVAMKMKQDAYRAEQMKRLEMLKRVAMGDFSDYLYEGRSRYKMDNSGRDEIKSISKRARLFIQNRNRERAWKENLMHDARKQLNAYLTGGIDAVGHIHEPNTEAVDDYWENNS